MAEPDSQQEAKADRPHEIRSVDDTNADTRRGGDVRTLLSPMTVDSTSGFMGVATIGPGDRIS
jgi:putative monooxygenase